MIKKSEVHVGQKIWGNGTGTSWPRGSSATIKAIHPSGSMWVYLEENKYSWYPDWFVTRKTYRKKFKGRVIRD